MTAEWTPADQEARHRVVTAIAENLCVEAGAGTGKTRVLVDRVVQIVRTGHARIDQLVIITFTERAAAELSTRVRHEIEVALENAPSAERDRLAAALRGLNAAHIETIHAFAASLLRERPIEAGLDPGFRVLDELPSQLAFEEAYDEWIATETAIDPPSPLVDALNLGLQWAQLREAADRLNRHRDVLPLPRYPAPTVDLDSLLSTISEALSEFDELRSGLQNEQNVTAREFIRMRELAELLRVRRGSHDFCEGLIVDTARPNTQDGNKTDWSPASNRPKDALKRIRVALEAAKAAIRQRTTARLVHWLEGFVGFYAARRRADGTADFDDLLIWARDLIRTNDDARRYFRSKYRCLLVDEFQDTDPIQVEMLVRLAGEDNPPDWRNTTLRPGSLFVVGDPKQSIYRFRRADIAMYDAVKSGLFAENEAQITQNFRSGPALIAWVNDVFERLIAPAPGLQPAYVALDPNESFARGSVSLLAGHATAGTAAALREAEAAAIASLVREGVHAGSWALRTTDGGSRSATFGDIAVLIPSRTDLRLYEDAFSRAGVPYLHEGGRTFFQRQEVRDLTAILRAIDDPSDESAIVAALRSEAFGCSDDDLMIHRAGARFDYLRLSDDASGPVADGLRRIRDLARERHTTPLVTLVRTAIDDLKLIEIAMLHHQGEQGAANVLKVLDQARAYAEIRPAAGLRGFVRWLKTHLDRDADETDAYVSEESDDVVRILTIHASKGLEFPVVIFANMNTDRVDRTNAIVSRQASTPSFEMKLGKKEDGFCTPGYGAADIQEQEQAVAEQLRLLYVAATRACDHLIVPFIAKPSEAPLRTVPHANVRSLNDHLRTAGELALAGGPNRTVAMIESAGLPSIGDDPPLVRGLDKPGTRVDASAIIGARDEWLREREELRARADAGLRVVTATSLKPDWEAIASDQELRRRPAAEFGVAVHAALERMPLDREDALPAVCESVAREYGFTDRLDELTTCTRNALTSPVVARALRAPRLLREAPFTLAAPGGGLVEGRMDLLFIEEGAVIVVDFKSDNVSSDEAASRTNQQYRHQALAYAWAAHQATGLPLREVVFLYVRVPCEESIPIDDAFLREGDALIRGGATV